VYDVSESLFIFNKCDYKSISLVINALKFLKTIDNIFKTKE